MLERQKFKEWLEGFSCDRYVGEILSELNCPLANHIKGKVWSYCYKPYDTDGVIELPKWASEFVSKIDSLALWYNLLTAKQALQILAEIKEN